MIAFFIHYRKFGEFAGGSERRFLEVTKWFTKLGMRVYALELEPSISKAWIHANYQPLTISLRRPRSFLQLLKSIIYISITGVRLCKKLNCRVVYAPRHKLSENIIPAYMAKIFCRKSLVIVFNAMFEGDRLPLRNVVRIKLKKGFKPLTALVYTSLDAVMRFIYQRAETCITVSNTMKKEIRRNFKIQTVTVSGDGVNESYYKEGEAPRKIYDASYLGRIDSSKGLDNLLHAWKIVSNKIPSATLVLIGGGLKEVMEKYRRMTGYLNLDRNVIMTGFVWRDEKILGILKSSKIFVFPSLNESFGISVAEAMACGLPCIISNIPALIENFNNVAVFVNPLDPQDIASKIINLLENERERENLGRKAHEFAKKLSWRKVAEKELEILAKYFS
jgi:glycosyltransferase involved in cell wall biosynthesis